MNRRAAGLLLSLLGFGIAGVGVVGTLTAGEPESPPSVSPPDPTATPTVATESTQEPSPSLAAFSGRLSDPDGDLFRCGSEEAEPDGPAHLDLVRVTARDGTNPVTGAPSTNLLLDVAAAAADPQVSFRARVAVEPAGRTEEGVQAVEWSLVYADGEFGREATVLRGDTPEPGSIEDFRVRYEGLGDRVEIEFYGPPGTRWFGVAMTDGTLCDVAVPD